MSTFSKKIISLALLVFTLAACQREVVKQYEVEEITLYSSASEKQNLKSHDQFISILYTDVYGQSISNGEMQALKTAYTSLGDKSLVIEIMIKSLLADSRAKIPSRAEMLADPEAFVEDSYKRFLVRKPSPQESWYLLSEINNNETLSPLDIYFAMLTSEEYRYY